MPTLQAADKVLGRVACVFLQPLRLVRALLGRRRPVRRILLIKFWGIGSLQLLTPAARALRERNPEARLVLLTLSENAAFARGLGVLDEVIAFDVRAGWGALARRVVGLLLRLRRERFDEVYDFEFFTRFSAVVSVLTGSPALAGFHSPTVWRGAFHDRTVPFNRYWHVARNFRALAGGEDGTDVEPEDLTPFRVPLADARNVGRLLADRDVDPGTPLVVLNPNAGSLSLERRWPRERFAALASEVAEVDGATVVLVGSAEEAAYTSRVTQLAGPHAPNRLLDLSGGLSIAELCALLERADAVVSNDSGPMHLAAALGTPTVGLFGPETPVMYRPLGRSAESIWHPPICSPCINVHDNKVANCIHGRPECLMNVTVDEVARATRRALEGRVLRPVPRPDAAETARTDPEERWVEERLP